MAEFSFLNPHDDDLIEPLDSVPYWQSRHHLDAFVPNPNPTTGENDSITAVDGDNQVNYVTLDLFPHGVDQSDIPLELDLLARFDGGGNLGFRVPVGSGSEEDENEFVEMDLNTHERQSDAVEVIDMDEDFDVSSTRNNLELERSFNDFLESILFDDFSIFEPVDEMLFWQPAENEIRGTPPASKTSVENLESVILTEEDVENDNALCAVCVDGMPVGDIAKQLPCSHRYHGDCIVRWLGIRNTCPVCRFELPTDDP